MALLALFSAWTSHLSSYVADEDVFVRIAALSGALAVCMGAYGQHVLRARVTQEFYEAFETGSRYHFYHTFALFCSPHVGYPHLFGWLILSGIILFSGSCYAYGITQNPKTVTVTPWGGMLFILGWLSAALL